LSKFVKNGIIKSRGKGAFLIRISLFLLLCLPVAWAEESGLPQGWSAEKIETGDEDRVFYSLRPADGREAQVVSASIYERLVAGDISAEAAYRSRSQVSSFLKKGESVQGNMVIPDPIYSTAVTDSQPDSYKQSLNKPAEAAVAATAPAGFAPTGFSNSGGSLPEQPGKYSASGASALPANSNFGASGFNGGAAPSSPGASGNNNSGGAAAAAAGNENSNGSQAGNISVAQTNGGVNGQGISFTSSNNRQTASTGSGSQNTSVNRSGGGSFASTTTTTRAPGSPTSGCAAGNGSTPGACNYNVGDGPASYSAAINQAAGDAGAWVGGVAGGYAPKTTTIQPVQPAPK
jgi:hypothetical protein